ncbi:MAG: sigma-E processing peptidase SpoIIGA [Oscillospiraceae bacterium]
MKITIYADVLIIINFLVNYFLLRGAALISGCAVNRVKIVLSALIGSLFSLLIFAEIDSGIASLALKLAVLLISTFIAFGFVNIRLFLRNFACLSGINALCAGVLMLMADKSNVVYHNNLFFYFNISPVLLVGCMISVFLIVNVFTFLLKDRGKNETITIKVSIEGRSVFLKSFYDTGFKLSDILLGRAVMLCSSESVKEILPQKTIEDIANFSQNKKIDQDTKFSPIFYSTINGNGILPAIKPQKVMYIKNKMEKELKNVVIALTDEKFSQDIQLLYGREIHEMIGD